MLRKRLVRTLRKNKRVFLLNAWHEKHFIRSRWFFFQHHSAYNRFGKNTSKTQIKLLVLCPQCMISNQWCVTVASQKLLLFTIPRKVVLTHSIRCFFLVMQPHHHKVASDRVLWNIERSRGENLCSLQPEQTKNTLKRRLFWILSRPWHKGDSPIRSCLALHATHFLVWRHWCRRKSMKCCRQVNAAKPGAFLKELHHFV